MDRQSEQEIPSVIYRETLPKKKHTPHFCFKIGNNQKKKRQATPTPLKNNTQK